MRMVRGYACEVTACNGRSVVVRDTQVETGLLGMAGFHDVCYCRGRS